jgi:cobalt-zinc-cadmium efflux system protein
MADGHDHGGSRRALAIALALTSVFGVAELVAGLAFDSLALRADAVHNIADGLAIAIALGAAWAASRPATTRRTFGWMRLEILAALINGLALAGLAVWIFWDAVSRLRDAPTVSAGGVLVVGLAGIAVNGAAALVLSGGEQDMNRRAARAHLLADVLGSAAAAVAAIVILATGWQQADAVAGIAVGALILVSCRRLIERPLDVLLEAAPAGMRTDDIGEAIAAVPGVRSVHDLHVWTITSGMPALSAHVVAAPDADQDAILHEVEARLVEFGLEHTTIQIDRDHSHALLAVHRRDCPEGPRALTESMPKAVRRCCPSTTFPCPSPGPARRACASARRP